MHVAINVEYLLGILGVVSKQLSLLRARVEDSTAVN